MKLQRLCSSICRTLGMKQTAIKIDINKMVSVSYYFYIWFNKIQFFLSIPAFQFVYFYILEVFVNNYNFCTMQCDYFSKKFLTSFPNSLRLEQPYFSEYFSSVTSLLKGVFGNFYSILVTYNRLSVDPVARVRV